MSIECRIRPFNTPPKTPQQRPDDRPDLRKPPVLWVSRACHEVLERALGAGGGAPVQVRVERLRHGEGLAGGKKEDGEGGERLDARPLSRLATAMSAAQDLKNDAVKMTRAFMEGVGFHTGDLVRISAVSGGEKAAERVVVQDITEEAALEGKEKTFWELGVWEHLIKRTAYVYPGAIFDLKLITSTRQFKITSVNSLTDSLARIQSTTKVFLAGPKPTSSSSSSSPSTVPDRILTVTNVPGLGRQMESLNDFLSEQQSPAAVPLAPRWRTASIAIHGGRGTGKTFVLDRIAAAAAGLISVHRVDRTTGAAALKETFAQAIAQAPAIVLVDDLDDMLEAQRTAPQLVGYLTSTLDEIAADAAEKGGSAGVVVVATCKDYFALPHELRRLRRLARAIALPVPDVRAKVEILDSFAIPLPEDIRDEVTLEVAKRTYAFNPEDLEKLAANALDAAVRRHKKEAAAARKASGDGAQGEGGDDTAAGVAEFYVRREEMEGALARTTPSSLNDINLRPPTVHWRDIGGQQKVKDELQRMIREVLGQSPLCLQPPKGILLYGPPGCAKTFTAQALATESGFNFFSVKGPELLSQYVGETERAIRRLFQRAAASSPAIIFFDELDTMGITPRRGGGGSGGSAGGGGGSGGVGVGVLGALLTELDGFESLEDVVVLAATNSPESIEPALLRSGRLDRYLFVGPPSAEERADIFGIYTRKVPVADDVDLAELGRLTEGYTGADIRGVVNEAGHVVFTETGGNVAGAVIAMEHLKKAIEGRGPSVTSEMLKRYAGWKPSHNFRS